MKALETLDIQSWDAPILDAIQNQAVDALENGKVLFFPHLAFDLQENEMCFLTPNILSPKSKNISYDIRTDRFAGSAAEGKDKELLKEMVRRYAVTTRDFLLKLIPHYTSRLIQAKTSFRPAEIYGRKSSYRKDDTRLHVDSFPSSPSKGMRIFRIFTNIHPEGKVRVWRVGEPFEDVVQKMSPRVSHPIFGVAKLLQLLKITKDYRTPYDHYMLQIHDAMKRDMDYQKQVPQDEVLFSPGASWMCFTDQVSHAALSGQHVLEQTFHIPVEGLKNPDTSPLRVLERYFNKALV